MFSPEAGEVSPRALMAHEREIPVRSEGADQCKPEPCQAAGRVLDDHDAASQWSPRLHRQESAAYRRDSGRGQKEHDVLPAAFDARDVLLTRSEAAAYLRKSVATLERWARIGFGPKPVMAGRRALYRLTDLRRFVGAEEAA